MAADYDALATAGVSVQGKLVLVDADLSEYWANYAAAEATARGAIGVIMTYGPDSAPYYSFAPDALGTFDGCWQLSYDPTVYIAKQDGDWLKTQLAADGTGPAATMKLIEKVRMAGKGGVGYNVFGDLPGTVNDGTFVLLAAHHDAYFHSGTDDTSCVADNLAIAKAMVASGYQPKHTVRFMFDTAEEFGYTNAYYDWCIGAWQAITQRHPAWAGKIRLFLNSDYFANEAPLDLSTSADLAPLTRHVVATSAALLPHGSSVSTAQGTWTDGWTFQAAGVPTIAFGASADNADNGTYHTQYMLPGQVDWPYVAKIAKVTFRLADAVQTGLLPYNVETRATELASQVVPADLTRGRRLDHGGRPPEGRYRSLPEGRRRLRGPQGRHPDRALRNGQQRAAAHREDDRQVVHGPHGLGRDDLPAPAGPVGHRVSRRGARRPAQDGARHEQGSSEAL